MGLGMVKHVHVDKAVGTGSGSRGDLNYLIHASVSEYLYSSSGSISMSVGSAYAHRSGVPGDPDDVLFALL
jgi:hypothetical protein